MSCLRTSRRAGDTTQNHFSNGNGSHSVVPYLHISEYVRTHNFQSKHPLHCLVTVVVACSRSKHPDHRRGQYILFQTRISKIRRRASLRIEEICSEESHVLVSDMCPCSDRKYCFSSPSFPVTSLSSIVPRAIMMQI